MPELSPELARQIEALVRQSMDQPNEWFKTAPDRWLNLPEHQREWLQSKSRAELEKLDTMLRLNPEKLEKLITDYDSAQTIGRAFRWLAFAIGSIFASSYAAVKMGIDVFGWFKGVSK